MVKVRFVVLAGWMATSCAPAAVQPTNEAPAPAPERAAEQQPIRWGDVQVIRRDPVFGETAVSYGSTLHTDDDVAFRVKLRRSGFAWLANVSPSGKTAFEKDFGRIAAAAEARIPTEAGEYLQLDSVLGTEYVILMLSEAPLEPATIESLRDSVLRAERPPVRRSGARKPSKTGAEPAPAPPPVTESAAPVYEEFEIRERGVKEGRGRYIEIAGGERAVTWIRFEHRPRERRP